MEEIKTKKKQKTKKNSPFISPSFVT